MADSHSTRPAHNRKELTGMKFGRLRVLTYIGLIRKKARWECVCDCGNRTVVEAYKLTSGHTASCGCLHNERSVKDWTKKKFGRLQPIEYFPSTKGKSCWLCVCDCGNQKKVRTANLVGGNVTSCGCYRREIHLASVGNRTHGLSKTPEARTWRGMKNRCQNPRNDAYPRYGGRGVLVCQGWSISFVSFYADMGPRPSLRCTLDRIDNARGYTCGHCGNCKENGWLANCRWATKKQQSRNTISNIVIDFRGQARLLIELAEEFGIRPGVIRARMSHGWPVSLAVVTPLNHIPPDLELVRGPVDPQLVAQDLAHAAVRKAVRDGKLMRALCCQDVSGCERTRVEAHHHNGYAPEKWLDVVWLCKQHHIQADRKAHKAIDHHAQTEAPIEHVM